MRWLVTLHLQAGSEGRMPVLNLLCLFRLIPRGHEMVLPLYLGWVFLPPLTQSRKSLTVVAAGLLPW